MPPISRREFARQTAAAIVAPVIVPALAGARRAVPSERIAVAVIGHRGHRGLRTNLCVLRASVFPSASQPLILM